MGKVVTVWESVKEKEMKETKILWERAFDQSYEKAGGEVVLDLDRINLVKAPVYWEVSDTDVNAKYKSMLPRFLLEVSLTLTIFWSFIRFSYFLKDCFHVEDHNCLPRDLLQFFFFFFHVILSSINSDLKYNFLFFQMFILR